VCVEGGVIGEQWRDLERPHREGLEAAERVNILRQGVPRPRGGQPHQPLGRTSTPDRPALRQTAKKAVVILVGMGDDHAVDGHGSVQRCRGRDGIICVPVKKASGI